ncbi:StAR-related lipid transfer protein 7, mitochondrial [Cucurbita argyrosperma subsp. argyrosperma]|nr:StAR-related lipid transfer protein 7, mitochondrial [Cucurbita argyrosperma subsp. argyrosperma]
MALLSILSEILGKPRIVDVLGELMVLIAPLWIAVSVGVLVGWSWKPKWANLGREMLGSSGSDESKSTSTSFSLLGSIPSFNSLNFQMPSCLLSSFDGKDEKETSSSPSNSDSDSSLLELEGENLKVVNDDDLEYLWKLVEEKDGGPAWIQMMDRSTSNMSYQAWRRDPETGPPQYRSRTVYENATPEMVREFFWDDEFRSKWDDMLISARTLAECPTTGTMVVHWVRKFPFFCSDREYIIGRRIWEAGRSYYCVTKSVPCSSVPRCNKPRRVDLYYSSWCIRAAESKKGDGQLTACEVILFHYEDMGIPWEIAKLGVRQGMWGTVKKIDPGLRAYQKERASSSSVPHCAFMAQINTKVNVDYLRSLENSSHNGSMEDQSSNSSEKPARKNIPKLLVVGGAIALACTIDRGLLTKAVIFGIGRRFAKIGRRL